MTNSKKRAIIITERREGEIKMTRTREEITRRIEQVENNAFYLNMKDRWTRQDFQTMRDYDSELRELKRELEEAE